MFAVLPGAVAVKDLVRLVNYTENGYNNVLKFSEKNESLEAHPAFNSSRLIRKHPGNK